jgi:hypothetical protein
MAPSATRCLTCTPKALANGRNPRATRGTPSWASDSWGDDLYGYADNRFLAGCEYVAKYNLGEDVPFHAVPNSSFGTQTSLSPAQRGEIRPVWELVYNHYVKRKRLAALWTTKMAEKVRPEGGGGDYGPNSGGFDQLGYGTLTASLEDADKK